MSIREVAERAGVSPATVSRTFTQPKVVAADTRDRVLSVAAELNYSPHSVASSLARGRTGALGIVVPDIANAFCAVITKAVQREARRDGYALFVSGTDEQAQDEERWAFAMAPQVEGLVLVSPSMPDDALRRLAGIVPVVLTDRLIDGLPAVIIDATDAAAHAVEHLHALGHRRIAYLGGPEANHSNEIRLRGYRGACERLGLEPTVLGPFNARFSSGLRAADLVLASGATGVLAYNDEVAVGAVNRLFDRGVRVPGDISVVGFDDTSLAEMVTPRLTTVRMPAAAAGREALRVLLSVVTGNSAGVISPIALQAELIIRASSGPTITTTSERTATGDDRSRRPE